MPVDPATLSIRLYPDPILRTKSQEVEPTPEVRAVAARMVELMRQAEGIGLAANQVGLAWRVFVCHVPEDPELGDERSASVEPATAQRGPAVFINPVVEKAEGAPELYEEGCLSLPGVLGEVIRPPVVTMSALGVEGQRFTLTAGGLLARCLQHELDHLDGVMIMDRMTQLARTKTRTKIKALERQAK